MKYLKMLALAAVAAGALMAFIGAGSASASVVCSTSVDPCPTGQKWTAGTALEFSIPAGQSANLVETNNPPAENGESINTCKESTVGGKITKVGSSTETVTGEITALTWKGCTFPTTTTVLGKLEIHKIVGGGGNGTLTADGETRVTINTVFFGSCVYTVESGKSIGDVTEGNPSVFHANAVAHKREGSNFACPTTAVWTATYEQTVPAGTTFYVTNG